MVYTAYVDGELFFTSSNTDISQGIGQAKLKRELNKSSAFDFVIYPVSSFYDSFQRYKSIVEVKRDGETLFRGRVTDVNDSMDFQRKVSCEGALAFLLDTQIGPQRSVRVTPPVITTYSNEAYKNTYYTETETRQYEEPGSVETYPTVETPRQHFQRIIASHNGQIEAEKQFTIGTINVQGIDTNENYDDASYRDSKSAIDGDLLTYHGGYLTVTYGDGVQYINWLAGSDTLSSQEIIIGENFVNFDKRLNIDELFTVLIPIGKNDLTISSVQSGGAITIEIADGIQRFGRIVKVVNFSDIDNAAELKSYGEKYIQKFYKPDKVSFSIKAVDLHALNPNIEPLDCGNNIAVRSPAHGLNNSYLCLTVENDLLNFSNDSYEIGDPEETLSELYNRQQNSSKSATSAAASTASAANSNSGYSSHACKFNKEGFKDQVYDDFSLKAKTMTIEADIINIKANEITVNAKLISINNDLVRIDGEIVNIKDLYVAKADIDELMASYLSTGTITVYKIEGETCEFSSVGADTVAADSVIANYIAMESHSHSVGFSNGVLTIGAPQDAQGSFNVAATQWYADQIAAAKLDAWNAAAQLSGPNANNSVTFPKYGTVGSILVKTPTLSITGYEASSIKNKFQAYTDDGNGGWIYKGEAVLVSDYTASTKGTAVITGWT